MVKTTVFATDSNDSVIDYYVIIDSQPSLIHSPRAVADVTRIQRTNFRMSCPYGVLNTTKQKLIDW